MTVTSWVAATGEVAARGEGKPAAAVRLRSAGGDGGVPPERRRPPVQRRRPRGPRRGEEAAASRRGSQRDQPLWENPAAGTAYAGCGRQGGSCALPRRRGRVGISCLERIFIAMIGAVLQPKLSEFKRDLYFLLSPAVL